LEGRRMVRIASAVEHQKVHGWQIDNCTLLGRWAVEFRSYAVGSTAISGGCRQDASVPGATA